jgi:peroxiredoxin
MQFSRHWIALILVLLAGNTIAGIPDNAKDVRPLSVGSPAPTFTARTTDGAVRTFSAGNYPKSTVILFYHYTLLSDSKLEAAKAFHIAYHVDDGTVAKMRDYGTDLEVTSGTKQHELPVPSVFIIDRSGTIRYVYSNADYTVRLGADALWAAAARRRLSDRTDA